MLIDDSVKIDRPMILTHFAKQLGKNQQVKNFHIKQDKIELTHQSLFNIHYQVEIFIPNQAKNEIDYEIKLNKLINISIALIIFIAFFSSFGIVGFLWFSAIFTLLFFTLNVFIIDKYIRSIIKLSLNNQAKSGGNEEILSNEQVEWIKDQSKCPACGEEITDYDQNCPECGLRLRDKVPQGPFDISKYQHKRIKYYYKDKRKEKND
jgi:hypothetical protein